MFQNKGFTLIEMLLVISIILTLSVLSFPFMNTKTIYITDECVKKQIGMIINQAKSKAIISHEKVSLIVSKQEISFIDHQKKINSEMNIGMVTNGELLTESIGEKLIYYGLNNIQFSIDGATENSHDWLRNKKGLFENLLHTIMQLNILRRKAKSDIKISAVCCLNKRNYEELPKIIELCTRLGIDILRVQPLMKMGRAKEGLDAYSLSKNEYIQSANY